MMVMVGGDGYGLMMVMVDDGYGLMMVMVVMVMVGLTSIYKAILYYSSCTSK